MLLKKITVVCSKWYVKLNWFLLKMYKTLILNVIYINFNNDEIYMNINNFDVTAAEISE